VPLPALSRRVDEARDDAGERGQVLILSVGCSASVRRCLSNGPTRMMLTREVGLTEDREANNG
jgi:hypothetical protein